MKNYLYGIIFYSFFISLFEILINICLYASLALKLSDFVILCIICLMMFSLLLFFISLKMPKRIYYICYILIIAITVLLNVNAGNLNNKIYDRKAVFIGIKLCRTVFFIAFIRISYIKIFKINKSHKSEPIPNNRIKD